MMNIIGYMQMQVGDKLPDVRTNSSDVCYGFRGLFGEACDRDFN